MRKFDAEVTLTVTAYLMLEMPDETDASDVWAQAESIASQVPLPDGMSWDSVVCKHFVEVS